MGFNVTSSRGVQALTLERTDTATPKKEQTAKYNSLLAKYRLENDSGEGSVRSNRLSLQSTASDDGSPETPYDEVTPFRIKLQPCELITEGEEDPLDRIMVEKQAN